MSLPPPKLIPKFQLKMIPQITLGRTLPDGKLSGYQLFQHDALTKTPHLSHLEIVQQWNLLSTAERELWKQKAK